MKIAAVQMVSTPSVERNLETARRLVARAAADGATLVVLPEYFCFMGKADRDKLAAMRQGVARLCEGADLVIYDTMFTPEDYRRLPHYGHSRPSDAIALAIRTEAPIFAADDVIAESAIEFEGEEVDEEQLEAEVVKFRSFLDDVTPEQLDKLPIDYIEKRNALVDAVTLDDAKNAAQRLWGQGLLTVIVGRAPQAAAQPAVAPPKAN